MACSTSYKDDQVVVFCMHAGTNHLKEGEWKMPHNYPDCPKEICENAGAIKVAVNAIRVRLTALETP